MKKNILPYLLAIIGAVLLAGLVASCGESPEPKFKVIESKEYTDANMNIVGDGLYQKHLNGRPPLSNPETIFAPYKKDVDFLIMNEMNKKKPDIGLFMVIKMDLYKMFCQCSWNNNAGVDYTYWVFDNN